MSVVKTGDRAAEISRGSRQAEAVRDAADAWARGALAGMARCGCGRTKRPATPLALAQLVLNV